MSNKTRKRLWPVSLVMAVAVVGVVAAFLMVASSPTSTQAHDGATGAAHCQGMNDFLQDLHDAAAAGDHTCDDPPTATVPPPIPTEVPAGAVGIDGFSSSPSGKADLTIKINTDMTGSLPIGSEVILYLDDKFQVPETITSGTVKFVSYSSPSSGSPRTASVKVDDGDSEQLGEDAWAIIATVPNMATDDNPEGIDMGDDLALVIDEAAGIKSPTEAGDYKYGHQVVRPGGPSMDFDMVMGVMEHTVDAKVSLDDENNKRGYELTITGSGFNKGSSATAYVLKSQSAKPESCAALIADDDSESLGSGTVGDDHKVVITAEVTGGSKGDFSPGETNYICIRDDNSPDRQHSADVDPFELQHSIAVEPSDVASGEEVTVKLRDYPSGFALYSVALDGKKFWYEPEDDDPATTEVDESKDDFVVDDSDSDELTFDMPGGVSGTVEVAVTGSGASNKDATITVNPSALKLSQTEVAPNASIIISGSGFKDGSRIMVKNITLDDEPMVVSDAGTQTDDNDDRYVKVTSNGTFTATVRVWTDEDEGAEANAALDDDTYTIKAKDNSGFEGKAQVTVLEPTVTVMPETASPRDFIVISGENWPISTADDDNEVEISVDTRTRTANIDGSGRFRYEYQLRSSIPIGDEQDVVVKYMVGDTTEIEEETTFNVKEAELGLMPDAAAPGETITVSIQGMPPYTLVDEVRIDGDDRLHTNINTDREGDAVISDILIPFLDPGFYPVEVIVGGETRVAQLEVLPESGVTGVAAELPGAVSDLGDNLDAIFHFNNQSKEWTFFDPRPEFAELNTLTELNGGQPYWVLVKETQEDVDWNGRLVNFTCAADDCWNLEIW